MLFSLLEVAVDYPLKTPLQLRPLLVGFRKAAGRTQATMASHLGITQQTYAQLEAKPESVSMDRLFHVLKLLGVNVVLTQALDPQQSEDRIPERRQTAASPRAVKLSPTKKTAPTPATTTAAPRKKATVKPARGSAQGSSKQVTRKRVVPTATAPKKREDW